MAILPLALYILIPLIGGVAPVEQIILLSLFTLIISYGATLIIGMPWFLALSWLGIAGLVPTMLGSLLPIVGWHLLTRTQPDGSTLLTYLYALLCGTAVSAAYWKLARTPYDGPRQDWEERIQKSVDALTKRFSRRAPGGNS